MAFLLIDGFDLYPNVNSSSDGLQGRWLSTQGYFSTSLIAGRFGGQCVGSGSNNGLCIQYPITPIGAGTNTFTIGFAYYMAASSGQSNNIIIMSFLNGGPTGSPILGVAVNSSQQPYLWVGSNSNNVGASLTNMQTGSWHYIEVVGTINSSSGNLTMYLDGVVVASFTGNTGNSLADTLNLGGNYVGVPGYIDDLYVTNTAVRVGEARIQTLPVVSDQSVTWSSNGTSNWGQINSVPVQASPTKYVDTTVVGNSDLYGVQPISGTATQIYAVQAHLVADKQDSATRIIAPLIKSGSVTIQGANAALTNSYQHYVSVYLTDPNTGAAWTPSGVDSVLVGQTLVQ